jgi:hypothetical protein
MVFPWFSTHFPHASLDEQVLWLGRCGLQDLSGIGLMEALL